MLSSLFQGDIQAAEQHKRVADRLRIQNGTKQFTEGSHLLSELQAYAMSGDITRVRQVSEEVAPLAKRYPHWVPVLRYVTAEYHRMTRDYKRARSELEKVLAVVAVGTNRVWPHAAQAHVCALLELGDHEAALRHAREYVAQAEQTLQYVPDALVRALALARAHKGDAEAGAAVDALIEQLTSDGVTGLNLGVAHETRALIALRLLDLETFEKQVGLCRTIFLAHKNSALSAKYHRLVQEGKRSTSVDVAAVRATPDSVAQYGGTRIDLALAGCRDDDQRSRLALTLLTRQSGSHAGMLYMLGKETTPYCMAQVGVVTTDPAMFVSQVCAFLESQNADDDATSTKTQAEEAEAPEWRDSEGRHWRPVLLSHYVAGQLTITGVAALLVTGSQFVQPARTAATISKFYADRGATSMMLLAD
jgi:hypothetical protein